MSAKSLRVYSVAALASVAVMSFSVERVSAFTLSSPSLELSFANSQIENAYYYYHYPIIIRITIATIIIRLIISTFTIRIIVAIIITIKNL